jgi:hypothetical protein
VEHAGAIRKQGGAALAEEQAPRFDFRDRRDDGRRRETLRVDETLESEKKIRVGQVYERSLRVHIPVYHRHFSTRREALQDEITSGILRRAGSMREIAQDASLMRLYGNVTSDRDRNARASKTLSSTFQTFFDRIGDSARTEFRPGTRAVPHPRRCHARTT